MNDKEKIEVGSMLYSKSDRVLGWVVKVYDNEDTYDIQWSDGTQFEMYKNVVSMYVREYQRLINEQ
jgi:hypothetical protein